MRSLRSLILLVGFAIASAVTAAAQPSATELLLNRARSLEARGRIDMAAQSWQRVLSIDPNQEEALAGMARAAKAAGKEEESGRYLERLRRVNPQHPAISRVQNMVSTNEQRVRLQEAARLAQAREYEKAMVIYRQAFGENPPPGEWAVAYYETDAATPGGWERATAGLRRLVNRYPDSHEYRLALGKLLTYRSASRASGIQMLQGIPAGSTYERDARLAWRQALIWDGANWNATAGLKAYLARYPDPELQGLLDKALKQGPPKKAVADGRDLGLAYAALKAERLQEAEDRFQAILKTTPKNAGALAGLGYVRMKSQDFGGALENFEAARSQMPDNKDLKDAIDTSRFWLLMQDATRALKEQRAAEAETLYQKALAIRPSDASALEGFAGALMQHGNLAAATPILERLVAATPENAEAWRTLVDAKYHRSGSAAALATVKLMPTTVATKLHQDLEYQILIASAYQDAGDPAGSRRAFQQAVALARTRRNIPDGLQLQLASLYLQYGDPIDGAVIYQRLIDNQPENLDAWEGLMLALYKAKDYQRALRALEDLPAAVRPAALARPGFLRAAASLQSATGNLGSAEGLLRKALELESANGGVPSFYTQLQLAQIWLDQGQSDRAAWMFSELTKNYAENPEGWKGLMLVLHRDQRDADALETSHRIPPDTNQRLQDDPDYLSLLASLYSSTGQPEEALQTIRQAAARYKAGGQAVPPDLAIQTAWLLLGVEGNQRELFALLRDTRARTDLSVDQRQTLNEILTTWVLRSAQAATEANDVDRAVQVLESALRVLPAEQRIRRALAGNLLASGDSRQALALYRNAGLRNASAADFVAAVGTALAEKENQIASTWLAEGLKKYPTDADLLNIAGRQAAAKGDFRKAELYWRQAMQSIQIANRKRAAANTVKSTQGYTPDPVADQAADDLGALLMGGAAVPPAGANRNRQQGSGSRVEDRLPWLLGPTGAAPSSKPDPLPAPAKPPAYQFPAPKKPLVPQTSSAEPDLPSLFHEMRSTMEEGARASLLALARRGPEQAPPLRQADSPATGTWISEEILKESVKRSPAPVELPPPPAVSQQEPAASQLPSELAADAPPLPVSDARLVMRPDDAAGALRRYLKKGVPLETGGDLAVAAQQAPPSKPQRTPKGANPPAPTNDEMMNLLRNPAGTPAPQATPGPGTSFTPAEQISKQQEIEDQIKVMESRNTPSLGLGGFFSSRSGQPGFEKMMLQESDMEASTILSNQVRLTLQARAIFMNTPAADGNSTLRFGLLPVGDTFEAQAISGLGADVQLATTNFGLHFGATPRGFPVRNLLGGFRFRPAGGPITIQFERDNLKDSILAYAGARDPLSHTTWGGVVANTGMVSGNWGGEKSGAYFSSSFHEITGKNVESNQRIDGNVGVYWRLVATPQGSLTAGANLFAMHYEKNLRYFTLGQGGYFSPQRFVLLGVPVSWTGSWKHLQYLASTAIGSQSFSEESSAYFPTAPGIQSQTGPFYPRYSSSGTNYNADFRLSYQVSPNWYVGGFYNANNARFYTLQSVGFTVRYSLQPRPLDSTFTVPSIPDWRGKQPFGLP